MNEKKTPSKKQYQYVIAAFIIFNIIFATITMCILVQRPQTTAVPLERNPKFVIAGWDYPDEYGQGILQIQVEENSTSAWEPVELRHYYESQEYDWNVSVFIRLRIWFWMNNTMVGANDLDDGKNYQRHNVSVTSQGLDITTVFSQQNFTYFVSYDTYDPMWLYQYYIILNFLPLEFTTYTVTVNYEIYQEFSEEEYRHDCSDTSDIEYQGNYYLGANDYGIDSNGSVVEFWIVPDDSNSEGVLYKLNFTNIDNSLGTLNIAVRYRVEGATNFFRYHIVYDDASYTTSALGTSTDWATLNIVPETGKVLDYFILYNIDTPPNTNSGNLSVWIDYIVITNDFANWQEVGEAALWFRIPMHPWGMNSLLILFGMCLVVCSGVYLAKGGKNEISSDKVFYALVAFMMGWALIISHIVP